MFKVRNISFQKSGDPVKGLTVPNDVVSFLSEHTRYTVEISGNSITYTSGCVQKITKKEIDTYQFDDCKI